MEEVPAPAVSATVPLEDDELDEPDAAICVTPSNRPPTPSPTQAPPDVSPTPPTTPVEAQARKEPVVKRRKANTPPSSTPPKPTRPSKPPQPRTEPEGWWSLQAGRLQQRYQQLVKTNLSDVRHLISRPKEQAYQPLPDGLNEGEFAVHRLKMREGQNAVCVTIRRNGKFNQGLLLQEMDNPTLHRVLKTVAGPHYRPITRSLADSDYRQFLPHLDIQDYIGTP
ncbi:swi5-dependent recombination DNA repair protein 1 homolog [Gigantopelta aegis]|uniref:swi5-dependent recombination DNA repair protein 1 homolog n=1 Tax=Gigantopelta aegis TaxID=1735272 RepID=UPI001B88ABD1|nr:swi5-dependent recombination DNA repair protein 1 homolog [Gigantopelta aegis]